MVCIDHCPPSDLTEDVSAPPDWQARFRNLAQRQATRSRDALRERHALLLGPKGMFARLIEELEQMGREAPLLDDLARLPDRMRCSEADRALMFVLGHHHCRDITQNPFRSLSREHLCCMVYDDRGLFTLVERYAALLGLQCLNRQFFAWLVDTTRNTVERRLMYRGLLEHFDNLLPLEQCIYPPDYREAQRRHLEHEESLYGPLHMTMPLSALFEMRNPRKLLMRVCASERHQAPRETG